MDSPVREAGRDGSPYREPGRGRRVLGVELDPAGETPGDQVRLRPWAKVLVGLGVAAAPLLIGAILFFDLLLERFVVWVGG